MALRDSINKIGRFIGVLQPETPSMPIYDQNGYPIDDGGYYGVPPADYYYQQQYGNGQYDNGQYDNGQYGAQPQQPPPPRGAGGQRSYYQDDYGAVPPQQPMQPQRPFQTQGGGQPVSIFGNNQRSKRPPDNVVPLQRPEDGGMPRANSKHSEIIVCVRGLEDCQEIINALLDAKSVFINMEPLDDGLVQRVIDMLGGAAFALRGTMAKISHRTYLLAPNSVDVVNGQPAARGDYHSARR